MTRPILVAVVVLVVAIVPGWAGQTEPTVLFQDAFDDNDAGWKEQRTSWIRTGVEEGVFRITTQGERAADRRPQRGAAGDG